MLRKLMKHELRASGRIMLPMLLLVLVTAAGANVSTRTLLDSGSTVLVVLGTLFMTAFALAIAALCFLDLIIMIKRFYTNLLQDEGYVMMTLPVSVHQHLFSKLLTSLLWYIGAGVVAMLAIVILVFDINFADQVVRFFRDLVEMLPKLDMDAMNILFFALEMLLFILVGAASSCMQFYAALSAGHSFPNHKMLLSVAFYFGMQFALQLLGGALAMIVGSSGIIPPLSHIMPNSPYAATHLLMLFMLLAAAAYGAIFYFVTTYFLKKRLNLE